MHIHNEDIEREEIPFWRYTSGYDRFMREGHLYPAPSCGSPSIVWHIGLAPKRRFGDEPELSEPWNREKGVTWDEFYQKSNDRYDDEFQGFIDELNRLAERLQEYRVAPPDTFHGERLISDINEELENDKPHQFLTAKPQTLSFAFWWPDPELEGQTVTEKTADRFLRVYTQIQTHTGFATINFIIDAAKPYGEGQIEKAPDIELLYNQKTMHDDPQRRNRIRRALNIIRCSSIKQIRERTVEQPRLPEKEVSEAEAADLLAAADYLYKEIWEDMVTTFDLDLLASKSVTDKELCAERFADMRGHIMSLTGLETEELRQLQVERDQLVSDNARVGIEEEDISKREAAIKRELPTWEPGFGFKLREDEKPQPATGFDGFGRFHTFDDARNEGHTVLRSLWPFIRRISPWADYREIVGCGLLNWRALYVSTIGFGRLGFKHEDEAPTREHDVPSNHLPELERLWRRDIPSQNMKGGIKELHDRREASKPIRFLIVTKGEPQREQLGRLVERITYMETLRVFALKDIVMIRNAGTHLEIIGRMLDGLLGYWTKERESVESKRQEREETIKNAWELKKWFLYPYHQALRLLNFNIENFPRKLSPRWIKARQDYVEEMNTLIRDTDGHVINLSATLDNKIGAGGTGRILYSIKRAELAEAEFTRLLPTIRDGDIPGWTSYPQFVTRGLEPSFDFIEQTGKRLISLKKRIDNISQTIQSATLILEAEATRLNTETLALVARYFASTRWVVAFGFALLIMFALENTNELNLKPIKFIYDLVKQPFVTLLGYMGVF